MKKNTLTSMVTAVALIAAIQFTSCKGKQSSTTTGADSVTSVVDTTAAETQPVTIAPDAELQQKVTDATKDFPGVTATVKEGEITLTGNITRNKLEPLMMSLNTLHPKKINNNLTINKQ
jgi:hypothetical protein